MLSVFLWGTESNAQGRIPKQKDGSVKGAMAFFPVTELAKGFSTAYSPFPGKTDPVLDQKNWQESSDGRVAVRGFVKDAVMLFEWWTLLGDPIERYAFKWKTTGYYEVRYLEEGKTVTRSISRNELTKYPDLLKKFDRIEPFNVSMAITFSSGNIDEQKYYDYRKKYNINTDLGSAGYGGSYTIKVNGVEYLYGPSGENPPFIIPSMAVGGWPDWLNIEKKDEERTKRNIELFRLGQEINIHSYKITNFQWEFGPFIEIARQYDRYEKKIDSPKEIAEQAKLADKKDNGDDFWNHSDVPQVEMEVYRDPTNYKYGLKAKKGLRALPATYDDLKPTAKKGIFLAKTKQGVSAINNSGKVLASLSGYWNLGDGYVYQTESGPADEDCWKYELTYYENRYFENGSFNRVTKTASISKKLTLTVVRSGETYTDEDRRRTEKHDSDCYKSRKATAVNAGYTLVN